jgi:uncharacterized membrane protein
MNTKYLTKAAVIASLYVILIVLEIPFGQLSYGPIQLRLAEALVLLPLIESAAIPGVFVGCLIGNILLTFFAPYGMVDVIGGSLVTLIAAYLTSKMPNKILGILPPVILNGLIVSIWIAYFTNPDKWQQLYWPVVGTVALGELAAVGIFGSIVLYVYERIKDRI